MILQCPKCGETITDSRMGDQVAFQYFQGAWSNWHTLFQQAAQFASELGPQRVISISHSEDHADGVISIWYWK